jgi:hypothetical protein
MRVTSSLWVGAYVRRCYAEGAFAVVTRRGAEEAGAIFVIIDRLDGSVDLYGPAPQSEFSETRPSERRFEMIMPAGTSEAASSKLESEVRFDPDVWVVTVEDRYGRSFLEVVED